MSDVGSIWGPLSRAALEMGPAVDHEAIAEGIASSRPVTRGEHEETLQTLALVVAAVRALDARLTAIEARVQALEEGDGACWN